MSAPHERRKVASTMRATHHKAGSGAVLLGQAAAGRGPLYVARHSYRRRAGRRGAIATMGAGDFSGERAKFHGHGRAPSRPLADRQGRSRAESSFEGPSVTVTILGGGPS